MFVTKHPIPPTDAADSKANVLTEWNAVYDAHNEVACLMLGSMTPELHKHFENCSPYEMVHELKAMFEKQGVVERKYNMHNMGKTIGELHAMLIEYEKGLPKKAETPQVMMIKSGKIQKANKKLCKAKGKGKANGKGKDKQVYIPKPKNSKPAAKEHLAKDDTCHHRKEVGHWKMNYLVYLAELLKKQKLVGTASSSVSKNNMFYFNVIPCNGIYEIDMHDLVQNDNSIYNVSTKRVKHNLDSTYLWHCRLAHISKKRIEKLQQEGLLKSTDDESFDQCVSCLSGKMTRKSFPHRPERATDLLGIIHTDVCVHLDMCQDKVFNNEVENQLGKTIKALRSDRGGEYISQEFKDYLKACGIVQQLTPPYTPQHNGVSERRNRTLLDMVRSMMNLTTLPLSFWDYALESATMHTNMVPTRRSERTHRAPERLCLNVEVEEHSLGDLNEPTSYKAAMLDSESDKWIDAMNAEMQSMIDNMVWVLVDLPPNCKTVGSKWLFKIKTDMDGNVHTYKARLVAKGYTQLYGVDYEETFSPVADIRAIRILISIAAFYDYEIWQIDVKTAFLNGHLDEDIYMVQPEGFVDPKHPRKVCKLQRSIYGLKQASRSWNKRFDEEIKRFGFTQNLDEPCVYQKASGSNVTFLILYVDDIIIMGNHIPSLQSVKDYLGKCFAMKDLGEAAFILGIKIYRDRSKRLIGLSQSAYMDKILKRYRMDNSKRGHIPMQERLDLNKTQGASTPEEVKRMQNVPYASAVGSIMYAVRCTRPDVAFAQNITSRFQQNPEAELRVECYCDAGFETNRDDTKSQTGYVFILNGGAVDWKSSKQSTTAMSATEAEYIAASEGTMEAVWIRKFIPGLEYRGVANAATETCWLRNLLRELHTLLSSATLVYCDNVSAVYLSSNPVQHQRTKHIEIDIYFVHDLVAAGRLEFFMSLRDIRTFSLKVFLGSTMEVDISLAIEALISTKMEREGVICELVVMSSASSAVTYTSIYTDSKLGRAFWGADDEEIFEGGIPRVIVLGYNGLPIQPVASPSPDYIPGLEDPQAPPISQDEDEREPMFVQAHDPDYVPEPIYPEYIPFEDEHEFPVEEHPLPPVDSPTAESLGYVTESDPEENPEEFEDDETEDGSVDYPMDGGDDGDDDDVDSSWDDADDEEEDDEDEDEEEEEEHLALADSAVVVPTDEPISPPEGTEPVIPPPSTDITIGARITVRPQASISLPPEAEALIDAVTAALPSPSLPQLPPSLYIPPPVDCRDDIPESEKLPRKRLCLSTLGSRYEIGESSTARL
ncbi:retrotransposon protein, putative, ty1-copia subclass [Tanacetum coccineum]